MKSSIILLFGILLAVPSQAGMAQTIVYSWEGTIERTDPDIDPWFIGAEGKRLTISVLVEEGEVDFQTRSVPAASFILSDVDFRINGVRATSFGEGSIFFSSQPSRDSALIDLDEVEFHGRRDGFVTSVRLPSSTFAFTKLLESPPIFPRTMTSSLSGVGCDCSGYVAFVDAGVTVTAVVIPEPSTFVLAVVALVTLGGSRHLSTERGLISSRRRS